LANSCDFSPCDSEVIRLAHAGSNWETTMSFRPCAAGGYWLSARATFSNSVASGYFWTSDSTGIVTNGPTPGLAMPFWRIRFSPFSLTFQ
jgi:hypothetical protein